MSMGFQFAHIETHARVRSRKAGKKASRPISEILAEVERQPGSCPHVADPQPPTLDHGGSVAELRAEIDRRCEAGKSENDGKAIRKDQRVMMSLVASNPRTTAELEDPEVRREYEAWKLRNVNWAKAWAFKQGGELITGLEHTDEVHPHLHFYILPNAGVMVRADALHPGKAATAAAGGPGAVRDQAYRVAMRQRQDDYHVAVGLPSGLTRIGPGRRRLSRAEWKVEQVEAKRSASILADVGRSHAEAKAIVARCQAKEAERLAEADRVMAERMAAADRRAGELVAAASTDRRKAADLAVTASDLIGQLRTTLERVSDRLHGAARKVAESIQPQSAVERARLNGFKGALDDYRRGRQASLSHAPALRP